ncbi:MAG: hypothetical protein DMG10_10980 [Acidobacteria bacterium]|nr:MAG: hypothetical protein DMG10_10980 [Acidobacteriota bacterium]
MFKPVIRIVAFSIIVVGTFALTLGAILFQAASVTKAASDYTVSVTWPSALTSVVWPPSGLPFHLLFGVAILAGFTGLIFFRAPRAIGVGVLFFQAGTGYLLGGGLGGFFICREFAQYHFGMDAERLGEYWFAFESIAVWSLAAATLAVLRIFARKLQVAEGQTNEETSAA